MTRKDGRESKERKGKRMRKRLKRVRNSRKEVGQRRSRKGVVEG